MIQFDKISVFSDDSSMMVKRLSDGFVGAKYMHFGDTTPTHYEEYSRSEYEAQEREKMVEEVYRELASQKIRARYSQSEEYAIQRKALAVLLGSAVAVELSERPSEVDDVLEEFAEYNRYAEQCKDEARAEAPRVLAERERIGVEES